ncbi:MAG: hypothetical protein PCFJNLEI_02270 [Verrucomicrobiae bacterium]|nr:hypothetical protein [Verrucomicrobiae bacterium]
MITYLRSLLVAAVSLAAFAAHAATITVISIADSGPGSLRQAIADANNGDTIVFDPILATKSIALTSGELLINKNITINGLGATNLAVTGTSTSRVFTVTGGATATLAALTISGGTATNGGGIANFATLTLNNVTLTNNTATAGGALFTSNGVLTVNNSTLAGNAATEGGALFVAAGTATFASSALATNNADSGGAIANHGTVTLTNVTLTGNSATFGGGLYSTNGTATIRASAFRNNTANAGGAVYNDAGNTLTLTQASAVTGNGAFGGGGLYNEGTLTVTASLIGTNNALDGGGLYNSATLIVDGATVAGNTADRGAGLFSSNGSATVTNSVLTGNAANAGGGIYNDQPGSLLLHTATVHSNSATSGGGLATFGDTQVNRSTILSNTAVAGGGVYAGDGTTVVAGSLVSANSGGGLYNDGGTRLTVVISTLAGNTGGALLNAGTLTLAESTIAGNSGGGLNNAGTATVDNTLFAANTGGNLSGAVTSKGFNLSDDSTGVAALTAAGDQNNTPAGLDPAGLQNNGGPTATIALAPGSAAIAAGGSVYPPFEPIVGGGLPVYPPFTDQRGEPRFVCGTMDIGAFQTASTTVPAIELLGGAVVTNECLAAFVDPDALAGNTCGDALSVAGGGTHTLALRQNGSVVAWGDNSFGQTSVPAELTDPVAIAAGEFHSLGLREDGVVIAWGRNGNGQSTVPAEATNIVAIAAGGFHSLAVNQAGNVFGWGDNTFNQTTIPVDLTNAVTVAAGRYHSLALRTDGTVVGWGGGTFTAVPEDGVNYGQANVPGSLSDVVAIAAGAYHSLALRGDGQVVAWGAGLSNLFPFVDFGQALVPANLSNVVAIAAGGFHSLALGVDGAVTLWGNNTYGQRTPPAHLHSAAAIAGGTYHSLAIADGGAIAGWGLNSNNQTVATSAVLRFDLSNLIQVKTNGTLTTSGTATLTYSVTDSRGLSNSVARTVITTDTTPPVPNVANLPILTNACSITLSRPTATDACAGAITATTSDPTNYTARGTHTVNWVYTDLAGNTATQQQSVVIDRPTPPAIQCPANITTGTSPGQCGAVVFFNTPVTTPNCASAVITQLAGLPSGALFPVGVTTNTFQVTDLDANVAQCSFTVTVAETQPPVLTCPSVISTSTLPGQCLSGPITYPVTATDNCSGVTLTFDPPNGTVFAVGSNAVVATAVDTAGNTNTCTFQVVVRDAVGPQVTCPGNIITNALTGAGTVLTLPTILATDSCSSASVLLTPPSGSVFPPGNTIVTATAFDFSGNQTPCQFTVTVQTPRTILEGAYVQAQSLQINVTGDANQKQLGQVLASLLDVLNGGYWQGDLRLNATGKKAFSSAGKAAKTLVKLSQRTDTGVDAAQWLALARQISTGAQSLASIATDDLANLGTAPKNVASAEQAIARGDTNAAAGQPDRAVKDYAKAWQTALKGLPY